MKVILCEYIEKLGEIGDSVTVKDGYARNYLIPRKLAVQADSASAKQIEHELQILKKREEKRRALLTAEADKMRSLTLEFKVRAGEEDKIFGSVTTAMIAEKLQEAGFDVDRKKVILEDPIKALGIYSVDIKVYPGIETAVKVWVTGLEDEVTTSSAPVESEETAAEDSDTTA
ncbi:MAG: 50S ribosomal protein L9 [Candidatus Hydrogenedens sp.]|jgi:large subunit ribosomal protein L9|nr:50S ribosomal protein L9 [Candidatus Hydrogenedens sp.]